MLIKCLPQGNPLPIEPFPYNPSMFIEPIKRTLSIMYQVMGDDNYE